MLRKFALFVAVLLAPATLTSAQSAAVSRKAFSSDSMTILFPTLSPDERWLVFSMVVSNQETRLMVKPLIGGSVRELATPKGFHTQLRFTPDGSRLLFVSTLPQRGPMDEGRYLVSAPFDTKTGILTGPPRQITIDGVSLSPSGLRIFTMSPDGQSIAYVGDGSNAIKLIPLTGGSAGTLIEPPSLPARIGWSPDGKFVSYEIAEGTSFVRNRVSRDGGASLVVARSGESLGILSPDNQYSFSMGAWTTGGPAALRLFASNGRLLGEVGIPTRQRLFYTAFAANGKYLLGASSDAVYPVKIVSTAGGPIRQISRGTLGEMPYGWSADGELAYVATEDQGHDAVSEVTRSGDLKRLVRIPEDSGLQTRWFGLLDGQLLYAAGQAGAPATFRIIALSLTDGRRTELVRGDLPPLCCMHAGITGNEFLYRTLHGNRARLHAIRVGGASRLIGEIPAAAIGGAAVFQNRIVYVEPAKDSARLQLVTGTGRPPVTLATFGGTNVLEYSWSRDGHQLAVSGLGPQALTVYRFDDTGNVQGPPQVHVLPFEYWYDTQWLPDGNGLTMIAQPRAARVTEVAVVKLSDPQHPLLLTKDDPVNKWGYSLSPDGKFVTYSSEQLKGSSILLIDVGEMMKQLQVRK